MAGRSGDIPGTLPREADGVGHVPGPPVLPDPKGAVPGSEALPTQIGSVPTMGMPEFYTVAVAAFGATGARKR